MHIADHISTDDMAEFEMIKDNDDKLVVFLNSKIKEYFWRGFDFDTDITPREQAFVTIGNLGLNDVSAII